MCSPTWVAHIPSDMCSPTWETHFPSDMCSPTWETHIPSDIQQLQQLQELQELLYNNYRTTLTGTTTFINYTAILTIASTIILNYIDDGN